MPVMGTNHQAFGLLSQRSLRWNWLEFLLPGSHFHVIDRDRQTIPFLG
jgi:hypothetical protein